MGRLRGGFVLGMCVLGLVRFTRLIALFSPVFCSSLFPATISFVPCSYRWYLQRYSRKAFGELLYVGSIDK